MAKNNPFDLVTAIQNKAQQEVENAIERQRQKEKEEKERIQKEINRQVKNAEKNLSELTDEYNLLVNKLSNALGRIIGIKNCLINLHTSIYEATELSAIGASHCMVAVKSAISRCMKIETSLRQVLPSGKSAESYCSVTMPSAGSYNDRVHVAPEIAGAISTLSDTNSFIIDLSRKLPLLMTSNDITTTDLATAAVKMQDMAKKIEQLGIMVFRDVMDLRRIYNDYHRVQEEAIKKSILIPQ